MKYSRARQVEGGWLWTDERDGKIYRGVSCMNCPPHETREEAERHFYDFCLSRLEECQVNVSNPCIICKAPTQTILGNPNLGEYFNFAAVCQDHDAPDTMARLYPFHPNLTLTHS